MRHFTLIRDAGLQGPIESVVELGPGDSIGVGIAALLSGAGRYVALDVVQHADLRTNLEVLEELVELFRTCAAIPGDDEFPGVYPRLPDYGFPARHLSPELLTQSLDATRLRGIRAALENPRVPGSMIRYVCPWYEDSLAEAGSVDVILSQAALQDVEDLDHVYGIMTKWLKPGGIMSHQIDFSFPGLDTCWNGHWGYSDFFWSIVRGKRPYYFNRVPYTEYLQLAERHSHTLRHTLPVDAGRSLPRALANPRYQRCPDRDFSTSCAYILTTKNTSRH